MNSADSGRVSDTLALLERELSALWQGADGSGKVRASTLNLLALVGRDEREGFSALVEQVGRDLAARTFVMCVDPHLEPWKLMGDVSAVCQLGSGGKGDVVCAERVDLTMGAMVAKRVGSIVDALVDGRLPRVLYLGPGAHGAATHDLLPRATTLLLDSSAFGAARALELSSQTQGALQDLAFYRIRRFRDLFARLFDDGRAPALTRIQALGIVEKRRPAGMAESALFVGWLAALAGLEVSPGELKRADGTPIRVELRDSGRLDLLPGHFDRVWIEAELDGAELRGSVDRDAHPDHLSVSLSVGSQRLPTRRFVAPGREPAEIALRAILDEAPSELCQRALDRAARFSEAT